MALSSASPAASNRIVTIGLPSTNLKLVRVSAIPGKPRGAFGIGKAGFRLGGPPYRVTLSAVRSNPRGARIILLFAAGNVVTPSPGLGDRSSKALLRTPRRSRFLCRGGTRGR